MMMTLLLPICHASVCPQLRIICAAEGEQGVLGSDEDEEEEEEEEEASSDDDEEEGTKDGKRMTQSSCLFFKCHHRASSQKCNYWYTMERPCTGHCTR